MKTWYIYKNDMNIGQCKSLVDAQDRIRTLANEQKDSILRIWEYWGSDTAKFGEFTAKHEGVK